ncbi:MAG: type II toxin-antitoxin system Phd/YefM family antitoxin [Chloroflexota bacterium]|nr:type II toxin-antitoxin system Phd/YefM family antitoxin [Chloroflexota bacterium]
MVRRVSAAEARAKLSALMAEAAYGGQHVVIEKRGVPIAALIGMDDLERLEEVRARSARPQGALALVGAWRDVDEAKLDALLADIYTGREQDRGRQVNLEA